MNELQTLEIKLQSASEERLPQSLGSVLQGVLMEQLDPTVATELHNSTLKPYSQYIYYNKAEQCACWRISSLSEWAVQHVLHIAEQLPEQLYLKKRNSYLMVLSKSYIRQTGYAELGDTYLGTPQDIYRTTYRFLTSAGFKVNGVYAVFPEPSMIIANLLKKWNTFSTAEVLEERGLVSMLAQDTYVAGYHLNLHPFALEGTRINAVRGEYTLGYKQNIMVKRIISMLSAYAEFSGIGIKCALGMGGVETSLIRRKHENTL